MQSLKYAFRFIGASFDLALKHTRLQEPWYTLGLGSLVIIFVWFLPLALVAGLIGIRPLGMVLIGLLACFTLISLLIWGEVTTLLTAQTFETLDHTSEPQPSSLKILGTYGLDIATLALTLPVLRLFYGIKQLLNSKEPSTSQTPVWLEAHTLTLPVIAVEALSLKDALARIRQIVQDHLIRFRVGLIKVRLIGILTQVVLLVGGGVLAFIIGIKIANPQSAGPWQRILAAGVGLLIAWLPTMIGVMFSSYIRVCYATALYQWVRNIETACNTGDPALAQPPEILRKVLGSSLRKRER